MIEDARGNIDYAEKGSGPTVVLVPGSWGARSAWRAVITALDGRFRFVTTSLLGYGGTAERRSEGDISIDHEADIIETVIHRAGDAYQGVRPICVARTVPSCDACPAGGPHQLLELLHQDGSSEMALHRIRNKP